MPAKGARFWPAIASGCCGLLPMWPSRMPLIADVCIHIFIKSKAKPHRQTALTPAPNPTGCVWDLLRQGVPCPRLSACLHADPLYFHCRRALHANPPFFDPMVGVPIMLRAATAPKEMINAATALYQRLQLGSGVRIGECCTSAANRTNSAPLCPGGGPPVEFFPNTTGPRKRQRAL